MLSQLIKVLKQTFNDWRGSNLRPNEFKLHLNPAVADILQNYSIPREHPY